MMSCEYKDEIKQLLDDSIKELNEPRRKSLTDKNTFSLCVGTGISADLNSKMNGCKFLWNELVYGIARELFTDNLTAGITDDDFKNTIAKCIKSLADKNHFLNSENTMECVEYLKHLAFSHQTGSPEENYAENVLSIITYDLFYGHRSKEYAPLLSEAKDIIGKFIDESYNTKGYLPGKGKTLVEVARLIDRMGKKVNVLTYNYDDYLKTALNVINNRKKVNIIFDEKSQVKATADGVHIYHVHGYIPHDWDKKTMNGEFIFSENSYGHMFDETYRWANRVQAEMFAQKRVLFVGFSGVDTNFRRLMKELKKGKKNSRPKMEQHVMFQDYKKIIDGICDDGFVTGMIRERISRNKAVEYAAELALRIIEAKDDYYSDQLGIGTLWHYGTSEIPDMLNNMCRGS